MNTKIRRDLKEWIAGLTGQIDHFKIEIGTTSSSTQIATLKHDGGEAFEMAGQILSLATQAGWGTGETRKVRIYAMDNSSKTRTFQRTIPESPKEANVQSDVGSVMKSLEDSLSKTLDTVIEMANIHSSSLSTLSEVINHREHVSMALLEGFIDLSQDHADTTAANTVLEAIAGDDSTGNSYQQTATDLLSGLVSQVTGMGSPPSNQPPSADKIREWMDADPWFADSMRDLFTPKPEEDQDNENTKST